MLYILLLFVALALGDVEIGFPFDEQLPNVARIDQSYQFTIANSTYKSTNGESVTYEANGLPDWLSFDSLSRTFTGTPDSQDVGTFDIELVGSDSTGSLSQNYSMIVSNTTGMELSSSNVMFVEISQYGKTNGYDGLVVQEGDEINIKFDLDVFKSKNGDRPIIAYYGRSADRSSLPNWISFDSDELSFKGTVPHVISVNAPSFEYGFSFIGSDYYGYAGAEGIFKIVVGGHLLSTNINETIKMNGTYNDDFDITVPVFSNVYLDGQIISLENISSVEAENLPEYVTFNENNYTLLGQYPDSSTFDNFSIVVTDVYSNQVELPYSFDSIGSVFTVSKFPSVNATRGEWFEYELLESYFTDINDTTIDVDFKTSKRSSSSDWLEYHKDNMTMNGMVPDEFDDLSVSISASSDFDSESKSFTIKGVDEEDEDSSSSSKSSSSKSSSSSSQASETAGASTSDSKSHKKSGNSDLRKKLAIGLGVGIPALLLLIAAIILICCCVRRRKRSDEGEKSGDTTLDEEEQITGPGFGKIEHSPQGLAATNVKKLDKEDIVSASSSITHVEDDSDGSHYFDADDSDDRPKKSWRANDHSDIAQAASSGLTKLGNVRKSDASLSTVNTDKLFSVRLVEDQSIIRASQQSSLGSGQFISNNSLNALLNREDSGNIQRLDSDGNIVDKTSETSYSPRKQISRSPSSNLGVLMEHSHEQSKDYSTDYMSMNSNPGVKSKISNNSLYDDFKATQKVDGDYDWVDSRNSGEQYRFVNNGKTINMSLSENTIASNNSELINPRISNSSLGKKAKLVDFTRRSSLRESAQNLNYAYEGESVQIHNDDSE